MRIFALKIKEKVVDKMIIKFCNNCEGRPYTSDLSKTTCPVCGADLQAEFADDASLSRRAMLQEKKKSSTSCGNPFSESAFQSGNQHFDPFNETQHREKGTTDHHIVPFTSAEIYPVDQNKAEFKQSTNNKYFSGSMTICGRVSQYSSSGKEDGEYRRLLPVKIYQALVYKQRLEDVLHRFTVRVEQGEDALGYQNYTDIPVNVHGTISGGLQIVDNAEVRVHGKYCKGVLMADSIYIINNGHESKVGLQHSVKAITYGILFAVMLAFICFVAVSTDGNFFANIKSFCKVWLVIAAIITVLYLITSFSKFGMLTRMFSDKKRSFPFWGILLISLALAFLFVSVFGSFAGFGAILSGWIYSLVPIIIILVALFFLIKSMF